MVIRGLGKTGRRKSDQCRAAKENQRISSGKSVEGADDLAQILVAHGVGRVGEAIGKLAEGPFLRRGAARPLRS